MLNNNNDDGVGAGGNLLFEGGSGLPTGDNFSLSFSWLGFVAQAPTFFRCPTTVDFVVVIVVVFVCIRYQ